MRSFRGVDGSITLSQIFGHSLTGNPKLAADPDAWNLARPDQIIRAIDANTKHLREFGYGQNGGLLIRGTELKVTHAFHPSFKRMPR